MSPCCSRCASRAPTALSIPTGSRATSTSTLAVPSRFVIPAAEDQKTWVATWKARKVEIAVLLLSLAGLTWVLASQSSLVSRARRLRWFRPAFLAFTLLFIGWYAQGQLSIVNVVALMQAAIAWRSWAFYLYDPMTAILSVYVLATLVVWGRGTFCGWLCPFGALQEFVAILAKLARVPRRRLQRPDRPQAEVDQVRRPGDHPHRRASSRRDGATALVEVEPFKTAITMRFERSWPFLAYAVGTVLVGAVVYKFFCRYLCPLGAFLALAGRLRRWNWLTRRVECGTPCQTCRNRCEYQAIDSAGRIDYLECFQCMKCVAIYNDDTQCAPRMLERKGRRWPAAVAPGRGEPLSGCGPRIRREGVDMRRRVFVTGSLLAATAAAASVWRARQGRRRPGLRRAAGAEPLPDGRMLVRDAALAFGTTVSIAAIHEDPEIAARGHRRGTRADAPDRLADDGTTGGKRGGSAERAGDAAPSGPAPRPGSRVLAEAVVSLGWRLRRDRPAALERSTSNASAKAGRRPPTRSRRRDRSSTGARSRSPRAGSPSAAPGCRSR